MVIERVNRQNHGRTDETDENYIPFLLTLNAGGIINPYFNLTLVMLNTFRCQAHF